MKKIYLTRGSKLARKPRIEKAKAKSISRLKKAADAIFSLYIRTRDGGQCYTCPNKNEIKRMQNGHFVPRQYMATRYDETNNHCQCYACNMLYNGQPSAYAARLKRDFGEDVVEKLESRRKEILRLPPEYYEGIISTYKQKLAELTTP